VAQETGAKVVPMAPAVGTVKGPDKGADAYLETIDYNVKSVAQALR
jgi:ABC-type Zn uptake system ZnuABC Zn-binding protein ZnuA